MSDYRENMYIIFESEVIELEKTASKLMANVRKRPCDFTSLPNTPKCYFCNQPAKYEGWWNKSNDLVMKVFVCEDHKKDLRTGCK